MKMSPQHRVSKTKLPPEWILPPKPLMPSMLLTTSSTQLATPLHLGIRTIITTTILHIRGLQSCCGFPGQVFCMTHQNEYALIPGLLMSKWPYRGNIVSPPTTRWILSFYCNGNSFVFDCWLFKYKVQYSALA